MRFSLVNSAKMTKHLKVCMNVNIAIPPQKTVKPSTAQENLLELIFAFEQTKSIRTQLFQSVFTRNL